MAPQGSGPINENQRIQNTHFFFLLGLREWKGPTPHCLLSVCVYVMMMREVQQSLLPSILFGDPAPSPNMLMLHNIVSPLERLYNSALISV